MLPVPMLRLPVTEIVVEELIVFHEMVEEDDMDSIQSTLVGVSDHDRDDGEVRKSSLNV